MDERRHYPSGVGPGIFTTVCEIQGDYMVISWKDVTCDDCLNTLSHEQRSALESYKERTKRM